MASAQAQVNVKTTATGVTTEDGPFKHTVSVETEFCVVDSIHDQYGGSGTNSHTVETANLTEVFTVKFDIPCANANVGKLKSSVTDKLGNTVHSAVLTISNPCSNFQATVSPIGNNKYRVTPSGGSGKPENFTYGWAVLEGTATLGTTTGQEVEVLSNSGSFSISCAVTDESLCGATGVLAVIDETNPAIRGYAKVLESGSTDEFTVKIADLVTYTPYPIDLSTLENVGAAPTKGTLVVDTVRGELNYTPTAAQTGIDTFYFRVKDTQGEWSNTGVFLVQHSPALAAPSVTNDSDTVTCNDAVYIDVLDNDSDDVDLDPRTVTIVTDPTNGTAQAMSSGLVLYTPTLNYGGADSFTYTVEDYDGIVSAVATVNVTVNPCCDLNDSVELSFAVALTGGGDVAFTPTVVDAVGGSTVDTDTLSVDVGAGYIAYNPAANGGLGNAVVTIVSTQLYDFDSGDMSKTGGSGGTENDYPVTIELRDLVTPYGTYWDSGGGNELSFTATDAANLKMQLEKELNDVLPQGVPTVTVTNSGDNTEVTSVKIEITGADDDTPAWTVDFKKKDTPSVTWDNYTFASASGVVQKSGDSIDVKLVQAYTDTCGDTTLEYRITVFDFASPLLSTSYNIELFNHYKSV